jgi:hypothetical protein
MIGHYTSIAWQTRRCRTPAASASDNKGAPSH